jgi:hypothetical protein
MKVTPAIGYVPLSPDFQQPGDRRRFVGYAKRRNLRFEIASPGRKYDVVVLSQSADISVWSTYPHGKIIYDLVDSYLAVPRWHPKQLLRGSAKYLVGQFQHLRVDYKGAIEQMCSRADAVVCTTAEQRRDISRHCQNVHIALDLHSSVTNLPKTSYQTSTPIRIVWEGLGVNVPQLYLLTDLLKTLASSFTFMLVLVTDTHYYRWLNRIGRVEALDVAKRIHQPVSVEAWAEDTCAEIITGCDIAVIPLDLRNPLVAGKPENKLLLMWRMGMPVVCSATPAYQRAMLAAGTPRLACTSDKDWLEALHTLIADEGARRNSASAGRAYAHEEWAEAAVLSRWDAVFASIGICFS